MNFEAETSALQPRGERGPSPCFDPQSLNRRFANYESHRVVRAAKITTIWGPTVVGIEPDAHSISYDPAGKPTPEVGWYVVCYEDGYISFCPGEQFEKGYSRSQNETRFTGKAERLRNSPVAADANGLMPDQKLGDKPRHGAPSISLDDAKAVVATKTAPKVTLDSIHAKVAQTTYYFHQGLTIAVVEMANGFYVVGKAAPADMRNFDPEVGKRFAYDDAIKQVWPLEGYVLREYLHGTVEEQIARANAE